MAKVTYDLARRKALWDAICWMRRTVINLDRAFGAPHRHAQCLRLLAPVDEMSADSTTPPLDDRTDEQREDDAVRAYQQLTEALGRAGKMAERECFRVVIEDGKPRDIAALILGLRHISAMIDPGALTPD